MDLVLFHFLLLGPAVDIAKNRLSDSSKNCANRSR